MSRLALDIDPIAIIRNIFGGKLPDPVQACVLAEIGGVESIVCYFRQDLKTVNERDINVLREVVKSHFNVRCDINDQAVKKLLNIKPDMLTFVLQSGDTGIYPASVDLKNNMDSLNNYITDLRANNIPSCVLIDPDIENVKIAGKLEFDYIEFNLFNYIEADNLDEELAELENINSLAAAANKFGMGVNVSGNLSGAHLKDICKIHYLEDIVISQTILDKALAVGFDNAVRDFVSLL